MGKVTKTKLPSNSPDYDPVFVHARREALVVLAVWVIGLAWTVGYCLVTGYDVQTEQMKTILGIPDWVFWGVLVPWVVIVLFSIWFGLFYIADENEVPQ